MDTPVNLYAPSRASLDSGEIRSEARVWRLGNVLVMSRDGDLPPRCVKCNEVADEPTKTRKVYWHHPGFYALLVINVLLYIIVGLIARKTESVSPGLCTQHKQRRTLGLWIGWVGFLGGFLAMSMLFARGYSLGGALALLAILVSTITGIVMSRIVYVRRIDDRHVYLKGCGKAFLEQLPEYRQGTRDF